MNILIAGDFFISDHYAEHNLFDDSVIKLFEKADHRVVNQEAPITGNNKKNKIIKTGPHLQTSSETTLPYLKQLKVDLVTLANNHILDYGAIGLSDTFNTLSGNEICYVGAGNNLREAAIPFTFEKEGIKIAILNFSENEWSIAEENKSGANPLDIINNVTQIKKAKTNNDKVICIIHGGHEYYNLPSPRMVKQYRFYADNGADAIIGHHTHCIGGYEVYNNVPIFYSLGNFIFTLNSRYEEWYFGLLLRLEISLKKEIVFELYPVIQNKSDFKVQLLTGVEKEAVMEKIKKYKLIIKNESLLLQNWNSFLNKNSKQYLQSFSPINAISNRFIRAGLNSMQINKLLLSKNYLKLYLNLIRCEAHKDASEAIIQLFLNEDN